MAAQALADLSAHDAAQRRYGVGFQPAVVKGATSAFNVRAPAVGAGQNMTLSQQWLADEAFQQTLEVGWQVNPQRYGGLEPTLSSTGRGTAI